MRTQIALITSLAALTALIPTAAFAKDAAPTAKADASAAAAAAPAAAAPVAPEPVSLAAEPAPPPPPPPPAGPTPAPGFIRIDSDFFGLQLWGGGTLPLVDGIGLAMDLYAFQTASAAGLGSYGEYDIGPAITAGPFVVTPMLGMQFNYVARHAAAFVPQLYVTGGPDKIYGEFWFQFYDYKLFNDYAHNQINMRLFADYKLSDYVAVGPQLELNFDSGGVLNKAGKNKKIYNLPLGANVMFSNLGLNSSLLAFVGYETGDPTAQGNHLSGRLTYIHNF